MLKISTAKIGSSVFMLPSVTRYLFVSGNVVKTPWSGNSETKMDENEE